MTLAAIPLLLLLALPQEPRQGQWPPPTPQHPAEALLSYMGEEVAVRYAPGTLDRAIHVVKRVDLIVATLKQPLGMVFPLTMMVLTRDEWERRDLTRTYGLPQPLSLGSVAVPAAGDAGTVRKWKTWLGSELPDIGGVPMVGTADDASSLMLSDIVLQVEVCEVLLERSPAARAEAWIRGVLSHLAAISLWSQFEPSRGAEISRVWSQIRGQIPPLLALEKQLQRPDGPGLPMERWLLAESHLYQGAEEAHATGGGTETFLKVLRAMRKENRPPTRQDMLAFYPSLQGWVDALPPETGLR